MVATSLYTKTAPAAKPGAKPPKKRKLEVDDPLLEALVPGAVEMRIVVLHGLYFILFKVSVSRFPRKANVMTIDHSCISQGTAEEAAKSDDGNDKADDKANDDKAAKADDDDERAHKKAVLLVNDKRATWDFAAEEACFGKLSSKVVWPIHPAKGLNSSVGATFLDPETGSEMHLVVDHVWVELCLNRVGSVSRPFSSNKVI